MRMSELDPYIAAHKNRSSRNDLTVYDRKGRIDADRTLAATTRAEWQDYKRDWEPLELELLNKSQTDTSLIDYAKADAAKGTEQYQAELARNASRYGVQMTPAQLKAQRSTLASADTLTDIQMVNDARVAQKDANRALAQDVINIGSGVQQQGLAGLTNAASNASAREQAYKNAKSAHKANMYGTIGAVGSALIFAGFF